MLCEGGPRPPGKNNSKGIRVSIGGPTRGDTHRLRLVFGIAGVGEGGGGTTLRTNVTLLFEGEQRIFATQGDDKCTVDSLTQERVETLGPTRWCIAWWRAVSASDPATGTDTRRAGDSHQLRFCRPDRIQRR
jgi:hypothetical protein